MDYIDDNGTINLQDVTIYEPNTYFCFLVSGTAGFLKTVA